MTLPANPQLEQAPYGPSPVVVCFGPQGGPYTVAGALADGPMPVRPGSNLSNADGVGGVTGGLITGPGGVSPMEVRGWLFNGGTWDRPRTPAVFVDVPSAAVVAGTGVVAWTPSAGKKFRLMGWALSLSVAGSIIFCDNVVGAVVYRTPALVAGQPLASPSLGNGFLSAAANNVLRLDVTAGGNVSGFVFGTQE